MGAKTSIEGSNPSLSANKILPSGGIFCFYPSYFIKLKFAFTSRAVARWVFNSQKHFYKLNLLYQVSAMFYR